MQDKLSIQLINGFSIDPTMAPLTPLIVCPLAYLREALELAISHRRIRVHILDTAHGPERSLNRLDAIARNLSRRLSRQ